MCAGCDCDCKKGKPEPGCKCSCAMCKGARQKVEKSMGISAFGIDHGGISKSDRRSNGSVAGYAGSALAGGAIGSLSANLSPTDRRVQRVSRLKANRVASAAVASGKNPWEAAKMGVKAGRNVPGVKTAMKVRGGLAAGGAALAAGAYGLSRRNKPTGQQ